MQNDLPILRIQFKNEIAQYEIPAFRGAINDIVGRDNTVLFHNHTEDSVRLSYPLIQYKRINRKAAIVCIGEGTEEIGKLFAACNFDIQLGNKPMTLEVEQIKVTHTPMHVEEELLDYNLRKWLPLNQENFEKFKQFDRLVDRYAFLEQILIGNIISFAKGLEFSIEEEIVVKIKEVSNERRYAFKNVKMQGFDIVFSTNVNLPDFIGIGKGVSVGFGTVTRKR